MALDVQTAFRVVHDNEPIYTYTQEEAIAIAQRIALETRKEVIVQDSSGATKARSFVYQETPYVDYYLNDRIAQCEIICHGKPRVAGTRIMAYLILDLLAAGLSTTEIIGPDNYPDLSREDVLACIEYASQILKKNVVEPEL